MKVLGRQQEDSERARYRYAWQYFMAHYRERLNSSTGVSCAGQALIAVVGVAIAVGELMTALFEWSLVRAVAAVIIMAMALVWLMHSINRAVDLAMKANDFAKKATRKVDNTDAVKEYFDEEYPWIFH